MSRLGILVADHFRFARPPQPSEWAESNLRIPAKMSPGNPGPFSLNSRPWARPILDTWHPESGVRKCDVAIAVQMAKTTNMIVGICYRMMHAPVPVMIVGGMSADFAKREISKKRLHPIINENEILRNLKPHDHHLFGNGEMMMAYGPILVTGAGSDTNLAGSTQGIVAIDEASKIEQQNSSESPEAHPIRLAEDRTKDFLGQEFVWKSSTPNSPNHVFWQDVEAGTFTHFYVPCPHCGEYFRFEFESRKKEGLASPSQMADTMEEAKPAEYRSVVWAPEARNGDGTWSEEKVRETTRYICPHNGCEIRDQDKPAMLEAFEEKDENPNADRSHRSFRVPSFYSPKRRFSDLAMGFLQRGDLFTTGLQQFYNHELALPWTDIDLRLKDEDLWACKAEGDLAYVRGTVPGLPGRLFAGSDVGQSETHWVVGMIDREENIWVVDYGTVLTIDDLKKECRQWRYARAAKPKQKMSPTAGLVDSGDFTSDVYKMCQTSGGFWWPAKGSAAQSGEWGKSRLDKYRGLVLYTYVDKVAKDELYDLRIHRKQGRRIYFPSDVTVDLIDGLRGQERIDKGMQARWKKVRNDHYGDALKLLMVMSWILSNRRIASSDENAEAESRQPGADAD